MRIGFITSWNECCGISQYSKSLVNSLLKIGEVDIKVCANYPKAQVEPDEEYVKRFFHTEFLTFQRGADIEGILDFFSDRDIVHVQFESALYHPSWFMPMLYKLRSKLKRTKLVFTTHTAAMWPEFDARLPHHYITHCQMWSTNTLIPLGINFYPDEAIPDYNSIVSFGLGRNDSTLINKAIEGSNITYRTCYGQNKWLPLPELVKEIQKSWMIALLYPEIDNTLASSSVTIAMGCNRPILVTNTNWFTHVLDYDGLYVCNPGDVEGLKENINYLTDDANFYKIEDDLSRMRQKAFREGRDHDSTINKYMQVYKSLL